MHWIRRHTRGRPPHPDVLTPAEWRVVDLARAGHSNAEIAERLGITVPTVKTHMSRILDKLDLEDRRALATWEGQPAAGVPRRLGLAVPLGWLTSKTVGGAAIGVLVAVMGIGFIALMESGRLSGGAASTPTVPIVSASETPPIEETPGDSDPTFAPNGRTRDAALDDLIESLLGDDGDAIAQRHAGVDAREWFSDLGEERVHTAGEWAVRLASADRSLYAVMRGHEQIVPPREFDIVLAVTESGGAEPMGWSFAVERGRLVDIVVGASEPASYAASVARQHDLFLVLPPPQDLPTPPPGHMLDVRTGDAEVDTLLALVDARDGAAISSAIDYDPRPCGAAAQPSCPPGTDRDRPEALRVLNCGGDDAWISPSTAELRLERILAVTSAVHAVVEAPSGAQPGADHLVVLVTQVAPYRWDSAGLYERNGRIVGLHTQCYSYPPGMYPPSAFILPPPDAAGSEPDRTSGVAIIDNALTALRTGDIAALDALADWEQVGCVAIQDGIGAPPLCEADEQPGTLIDVVPIAQCEGGPVRREEATGMLATLASDDWRLHSVADIGMPTARATFPPGALEAILVGPPSGEAGDPPRVLGLSFTDVGFASVRFPCGGRTPEALMSPGRAPTFLLAPPP